MGSALAESLCAGVRPRRGSAVALKLQLYGELWRRQQTPGQTFPCTEIRRKTSLNSLMAPSIYSVCIKINARPAGIWKCFPDDKLCIPMSILCIDVDADTLTS